ncbi:MAG: hypothetical protein Fur0032_02390 [Terrimicrobiaceae bacterium]
MKIPISLRGRLLVTLAGLLALPAPSLHAAPRLAASQLDELLGPIALYPDALVAILLPASTVPADVVLGARYLDAGGDVADVDRQPWDDSVKSLVRYPDVLRWMNENLEWTTAVGEAFLTQPDDVMRSIQGLRLAAKEAGNLKNTPQQVVVVEKEVIRIVPAEPEIIYVPQYDPGVVFVQSYSTVPLITFGVGFAIGSWLSWDCDWRRRWIYRGDWCGWNNGWWNNGYGNWRSGSVVYAPETVINNTINNNTVNVTNISPQTAQRWQPGARNRQQFQNRIANQTGNARFANAVGRELRSPGPAIANNLGNGRTLVNQSPSLPRPTGLRLKSGAGSNGRNNPASLQGAARTQRPTTPHQLAGSETTRLPGNPSPTTQRQPGFLPARPPRVESPATAQRPARPAQQAGSVQPVDRETRTQRPTFQPTRPPRLSESRTEVASVPTRPSRPSPITREVQQPPTSRPRPVVPSVGSPTTVRSQRPEIQRPPRLAVQRPQRPPTVQQSEPVTQQQRPTAVPRPSRQLNVPDRIPIQRPNRSEARPTALTGQPRQIVQPPASRPVPARPARPTRQQVEPGQVRTVQQLQRPQQTQMSSRPQRPVPNAAAGGGPRQAGGRFANQEAQ